MRNSRLRAASTAATSALRPHRTLHSSRRCSGCSLRALSPLGSLGTLRTLTTIRPSRSLGPGCIDRCGSILQFGAHMPKILLHRKKGGVRSSGHAGVDVRICRKSHYRTPHHSPSSESQKLKTHVPVTLPSFIHNCPCTGEGGGAPP